MSTESCLVQDHQALLERELSAGELQLMVYHRDGSTALPLSPGSSFTIGRDQRADLTLREPSVSAVHARVWVDGGVWLEDLGAKNGVRIGRGRIERARLTLGELAWLGSAALTLSRRGGRTLLSHDTFVSRARSELSRSASGGAEFTLALIAPRSSPKGAGHLGRWVEPLQSRVRPFDELGLFSANKLELLLPELTLAAAQELLAPVMAEARPGLSLGLASYPADGVTVEALFDVCAHRLEHVEPRANKPRPDRPEAPLALRHRIARVAATPLPVLITGETGVGKELVAQALHRASARRHAPLQIVNCAAIPDALLESTLFGHEAGAFTGADAKRSGIFEVATGGTVFLDEVGELTPAAQAALLRVLDGRTFCRVGGTEELSTNVRLLAATHRDLEQMVAEGAFRQDLFYRLNAVTMGVPPLRERSAEILPLAGQFAAEAAERASRSTPCLSDAAQRALLAYRWPGNVRELRNVIERAVALADGARIDVGDLPQQLRAEDMAMDEREPPERSFKELVSRYEEELLVAALDACFGNQSEAARQLGLPRRTLVHKLKLYGITRRVRARAERRS